MPGTDFSAADRAWLAAQFPAPLAELGRPAGGRGAGGLAREQGRRAKGAGTLSAP
ncbi:hypothetical protein GCM10022284_19290 [Streptomyces hundungensis]